MKNSDDIFKTIASLLRMADDKSSPAEAALASEKAAVLIRKHNLDMDAVRNWTATPVVSHENVFLYRLLPESWQAKKHNRNRRWPPHTWYEYGHHEWFVHLSIAVSRVCDCEAAYFSSGGVTFVGDVEKVKQAAFLMSNIFRRLMLMVDPAIKEYCAKYKSEHGVSPWNMYGRAHPSRFRDGFLEGAAFEIGGKLFDAYRATWDEYVEKRTVERDKALAVLKTAIEVYKEENFAYANARDLKEVEGRGSGVGMDAGQQAGRDFAIQSGINGGVAVGELLPER